jgi:hypothetical protein
MCQTSPEAFGRAYRDSQREALKKLGKTGAVLTGKLAMAELAGRTSAES